MVSATDAAIKAWHVHTTTAPWCKSWSGEDAESKARTAHANAPDDKLVGPLPFRAKACPWRAEMDATPAEVPGGPTPPPPASTLPIMPAVPTATGHTHPAPLDLHEIPCAECGEPMDTHLHPNGASAGTTTTVRSRSTGPRKAVTAHPACPHCGGRIHWNDAGGKVNFECLQRQFLVAVGLIVDPLTERLPVATDVDIVSIGEWIATKRAAGVTLHYGKMDAATGGSATYSSLRSKTVKASKPPKPVLPVAPIQAAAQEIAAAEVAEVAAAVVPDAPAAPPEPTAEEKAEARKKRRQELLKAAKK